jgi:hypothetical protein
VDYRVSRVIPPFHKTHPVPHYKASPDSWLFKALALRLLAHSSHFSGFKCFPFNNFTHYLTPFSRCFSSFPHGTCLLSVSCHYLALDGIYHPFRAAFPNNSTLWSWGVLAGGVPSQRDSHPLRCTVPGDLYDPPHSNPQSFRLQFGPCSGQILNLSSSRFTRRY